jgi:glycosyltransferase involved in cell wall biosynthesis
MKVDMQSTVVSRKIVFLLNYLPRHFLGFYRRIASEIGSVGFLVSVEMEDHRSWGADFSELDVRVQKCHSFRVEHRHPDGFSYPSRVHIPVSTFRDLRELDPQVVVSLEVGARTIQALLARLLHGRFKLAVQVRESERSARFRGTFRKWIRKIVLRRVDAVIVNGKSGVDYVESLGIDRERIIVCPSPTDSLFLGPVAREKTASQSLRFLYVGSIIPLKGILKAVTVLAELAVGHTRHYELMIVGTGEDIESLKHIKLPSNLKLSFQDSVNYEDLPAYYSLFDILLMPSLCDEWGMVVNEAMARGLPVIGSLGSQAVSEMVEDKINGWTYEPTNNPEMRRALWSALDVSEADLDRMSKKARATAMRYSDLEVAKQFVESMDRLLDSPYFSSGNSI